MNLAPHRPWITPLVIGAFLLSAATGVLMFFHLDSGLNKPVHEWLSWVLLAAAVLHALLNLTAFKRYFTQRTGRTVIGFFAVLLALSFIPLRQGGGGPPYTGPVKALAAAPLPVLAQVAGQDLPQLKARLQAAGLHVTGDQQSVRELAGPELRAQLRVLNQVLAAPAR